MAQRISFDVVYGQDLSAHSSQLRLCAANLLLRSTKPLVGKEEEDKSRIINDLASAYLITKMLFLFHQMKERTTKRNFDN